MNLKKIFNNKRVLVTGHTGFKGSWLISWLNILGAKVLGISLSVPTKPSHFINAGLKKDVINRFLDIRDEEKVKKVFKEFKPDFVFHLAAQSLVKKSYLKTSYTWQTNLIGTMNVLESLKMMKKKCIAVIVTSDKCYKNLEIKRGYKESDILGGKDPYSASKASAEMLIQSYVSSFFSNKKNTILLGIGRAGNVIGGGDWSEDRLIPDCVKLWSKNKEVILRSPNSTRPWQHVLEAVSGYLYLAATLKKNKKIHGEAFNFGPKKNNNYKVIDVVKAMKKNWKNIKWKIIKNKEFKESNLLKLNSSKAEKLLKWKVKLNFSQTLFLTSEWYKNFYNKKINVNKYTKDQIKKYQKL